MIKFIILVLSIVIFVLSVIYFLYRFQLKHKKITPILKKPLHNQQQVNQPQAILKRPLVNQPVVSNKSIDKSPLLANARGGNFERTYLDHKSNMIKNKEKRVRFNEKVKTLNYKIQKQNEEIAKRNSMF